MRSMCQRLPIGKGLALLVLLSHPAMAQVNIESNAGVQLDFVNPGARSLALGGAFVGLADDATTAFTNPAGLRFISRREISLEGRAWGFTTPFTSGGRLSGSPTGIGIDTSSGLLTANSHGSAGNLAFVSFVYPKDKWAVAGYRQQLSNFRFSAESQGAFVQTPADARLNPYRASLDVNIARYGVSGSYRVNDRVSVGAGVFLYDYSLSSDTQRFAVDPNRPQLYAAQTFSGAPERDDSQKGSGRAAGVNVGIVAALTPQVQFGAVYRQGASFGLTTTDTLRGATVSVPGKFTVPGVFSAGLMLHPVEPLKVTVDFSRVQYSAAARNFQLFFPATPGFSAAASDFKSGDANEVHAGAEYVLLKFVHPVALRLGTWFDPEHAIRFEPANTATADPFDRAVFRKGTSAVHGTGGAGVVIGSFEVNAAGDVSSRSKTFSVSTVFRF